MALDSFTKTGKMEMVAIGEDEIKLLCKVLPTKEIILPWADESMDGLVGMTIKKDGGSYTIKTADDLRIGGDFFAKCKLAPREEDHVE